MTLLRNTGKREAELLVYFAKQGVHPCRLDQAVEKALEKEINELWDAHKVGENTERIDSLQKELTAIRQEKAGPIELLDNWCTSDGQWWI